MLDFPEFGLPAKAIVTFLMPFSRHDAFIFG